MKGKCVRLTQQNLREVGLMKVGEYLFARAPRSGAAPHGGAVTVEPGRAWSSPRLASCAQVRSAEGGSRLIYEQYGLYSLSQPGANYLLLQ